MDKRSLFVLAGICALTIGGCGTEDETASTPSAPAASGSQTVSPKPIQPFAAAPLVAAKDKTKTATNDKTTKVPGLLQATDPKQRAKEVQAGINNRKDKKDPFASLPPLITLRTPSGAVGLPAPDKTLLPSSPTIAPANPPATSVRRPSVRSTSPRNVAIASPRSNSGQTSASNSSSRNERIPNIIPALPPLPEPTLAKAVEVTGVIVVAGVPQAIVKAPNESTSRYVQAGQRLSNGQVLVKRIEVNSGSDPIVVLEQNGVEVGRAVGDKASPTSGGVPAAFNSNPLSSNRG